MKVQDLIEAYGRVNYSDVDLDRTIGRELVALGFKPSPREKNTFYLHTDGKSIGFSRKRKLRKILDKYMDLGGRAWTMVDPKPMSMGGYVHKLILGKVA